MLDNLTRLKIELIKHNFKVRACKYYYAGGIFVSLYSPNDKPLFLDICKELNIIDIEQSGIVNFILKY